MKAKDKLFHEMLRIKNVKIENQTNKYVEIEVAHTAFDLSLPTIEATKQILRRAHMCWASAAHVTRCHSYSRRIASAVHDPLGSATL